MKKIIQAFILFIMSLNVSDEIKDSIVKEFQKVIEHTKTTKTPKAKLENIIYIETLNRDQSEKEINLKSLTKKLEFAKVENIQAVIKKINSGEIVKTQYKAFRIKK